MVEGLHFKEDSNININEEESEQRKKYMFAHGKKRNTPRECGVQR